MNDVAGVPADPLRDPLRIWLLAARPATLPAAVGPVLVGIGAALSVGAPLRVDTAIACLAVALLLQVAANLSNDLSDFERGADTSERLGPRRAAATGLLTPAALRRGIAVVVTGAGIVGLYLVSVGGPLLLVLGGAAIVAAIAYTGGPWPYGYRGLGEVFVFVFFGPVAVTGTAYLQTGRIEPIFLVAAVPMGALVTAILVVNNLRDIPTDRAANKRTLAVLFGEGFAKAEYVALLAVAASVPIVLAIGGTLGPAVLLPLAATPLALGPIREVLATGPDRDRRRLNPVLRSTARLSLVAGVLFAVGLSIGGGPMLAMVAAMPAVAVSAVRVRVPFRRPFTTAAGTWSHRESWILRLRSGDRTGYGEVALDPGASQAEIDAMDERMRDAITGFDHGVTPESGMRGAAAPIRAALDTALIGCGRTILGDTLAYGGTLVPVNATVGWGTADEMTIAARTATRAGFTTLKLKIGREATPGEVVERMREVRSASGPDTRLRVDANGAWSLSVAERTMKALEPIDIEYVEQPLDPATGLADVAGLRHATPVPIALDEAVVDEESARLVLGIGAADVLVVKPSRVGGIRAALEIAEGAMSSGTGIVISTLLETGIGLAAGLAAAAAIQRRAQPTSTAMAHGLGTSDLLVTDLLAVPLVPEHGSLLSRDLGALELDGRALAEYAIEYGGAAW